MLPIVAKPLDPADWNAMLWLEDFRRIEAPGEKPYPQHEAIEHTLRLLALTPSAKRPRRSPHSRPRVWTTCSLAARRCKGRASTLRRWPSSSAPPNSIPIRIAPGYIWV
jgi:hypothetical protein